ncbi:MAG: electron transfer flavoprotein subunit alpha [Flavobacteriales bacterium]|jgi:electron transfer flavoprotein alpha subunit|nr:electron transfer flavoprotein subunit alpha [Flavobacteriales bacterium]|tara:strand:- start:7041 stop:8015 length:975 start_codon:yes stop_codon:yes gene_type:complete
MAVLTFVEHWEGKFKKTSYESISYGRKISDDLNQPLYVVTLGAENIEDLKKYGADYIINVPKINLDNTSNMSIAKLITEAINSIQEDKPSTIIISNTNTGKSIAPILASILNSGLITNAIDHPESYNPLTINCKVFSSKAIAKYQSNYKQNIITIVPNSIGGINEKNGDGKLIELNIDTDLFVDKKITVKNRNKLSGKISLSDAEIVVSAGRGLKSSENWNMIEELADLLGAGTACSKPVSDMGWRPHSEHVGQTGIAINPDLYIAIGISGAIQHLAGVSNSKNIVVINIDPEAPFFKAANYGIVGDAFTVVPKLIEAIKRHKN